MASPQHYSAEASVSVVLRDGAGREVAAYTVTRTFLGFPVDKPSGVIGNAVEAARAASRIMSAGVDNAEARRTKGKR